MTNQSQTENQEPIGVLIRANAVRQQGDLVAASSLYHALVMEMGESPNLCAAIADCYYDLAFRNPRETGENYQLAVDWIKRAIALSPDDARLHACLAEYFWLGNPDYEQAAQEFRKAILLAPNRVGPLINAAALYGVPEDVVTLEEATNWLERATWLEPNNPNWHARLGELYHQAGRLLDAKQEWRRALLCPKPLDSGYIQIIAEATQSDVV